MRVGQEIFFLADSIRFFKAYLDSNHIRLKIAGVSKAGQNPVIASQITEMNQWLVDIIKESQRLVPVQLLDLQENFSTRLQDLQQQFELIFKYDWDFDNFLEEDVPTAVR